MPPSSSTRTVGVLILFAATLFLSALLLFLVQPLVGKMMLPLLGGTPEVWNTCMVFFQAVLLAGYAYAHGTSQLGPRKQAVVHLFVLVLPLIFFAVSVSTVGMPLGINKNLIPGGEANPIFAVLTVLVLSVGVPFFVLSTSAPLLQKWFSNTDHPSAHDPYFLYGASNLGSMLSLVAYPFLVEPTFIVRNQSILWACGYVLLALFISACAACLWWVPSAALAVSGGGLGVRTPTADTPVGAPPVNGDGPHDTGTSSAPDGGKKNKKVRKGGGDRVQLKPDAAVAVAQPSEAVRTEPEPAAAAPVAQFEAPVTWLRRARWVLLGAVPSSLLMGVTTYITTDIAAIPLLWIPPLAIYLLTFIIVFANLSRPSSVAVVYGLAFAPLAFVGCVVVVQLDLHPFGTQLFMCGLVIPAVIAGLLTLMMRFPNAAQPADVNLGWFGMSGSGKIDTHKILVLALPLVVLLVLFMTFAEIKPHGQVHWIIALHLLNLFIIAMVCHGELAADRPSAKYLTEFFMWMSVGGVCGGLFNALFSPLVFNSLLEYPIAMLAACAILPPLSGKKTPEQETAAAAAEGEWGNYLDHLLVVLFLVAALVLTGMRMWDQDVGFRHLDRSGWPWMLGVVAVLIALGCVRLYFAVPKRRMTYIYDISLPLALGILSVALIWGMYSDYVAKRLVDVAKRTPFERQTLRMLLMYGVPCVLCYTFIERTWRFAAGVACLLLAATFTGSLEQNILMQQRSFFGVLKVEVGAEPDYVRERQHLYRRLVHGTTLHGKQLHPAYLDKRKEEEINEWIRKRKDELKRELSREERIKLYEEFERDYDDLDSRGLVFGDQPLTYYHRTGPVGHVMRAYSPQRPPIMSWLYQRRKELGRDLTQDDVNELVSKYRKDYDLNKKQMNLGVIGLGTGTMAAYGQGPPVPPIPPLPDETSEDKKREAEQPKQYQEERERLKKEHARLLEEREMCLKAFELTEEENAALAQTVTFYDIDKLVREFSFATDKHFSYVQKAKDRGVTVNLVLNDARLAIERELAAGVKPEDKFGVLIVDAFSSDAIPIHLITKQALSLFMDRVNDDGIVAYHVSNRYLDLKPVLANLGENYVNPRTGEKEPLTVVAMSDGEQDWPGKAASSWVLLARKPEYLAKLRYGNDAATVKEDLLAVGKLQTLCGVPALMPSFNPQPTGMALALQRIIQLDGPFEVQVRNGELVAGGRSSGNYWTPAKTDPTVGVWTDDYAPILRVFMPLRPDRNSD